MKYIVRKERVIIEDCGKLVGAIVEMNLLEKAKISGSNRKGTKFYVFFCTFSKV